VKAAFFYNETHQGPEKKSWDEQRILAANASSHEVFLGRFVFFVVRKEFLCYPGSLTHYPDITDQH